MNLFERYKNLERQLKSVGMDDDEITNFRELLDSYLKMKPVQVMKDYEKICDELVEILNLDEGSNSILINHSCAQTALNGDIIEVLQYNALCVAILNQYNIKYNINLMNPDDFGYQSFDQVLSFDALFNNLEAITYLNDLEKMPMFLWVIRVLIEYTLSHQDFKLSNTLQSSLYAGVRMFETCESSKQVIKVIKRMARYDEFIKENAKDAYDCQALYFFNPEIAEKLMKHNTIIPISIELDYDLFSDIDESFNEYLEIHNELKDFRSVCLYILNNVVTKFEKPGLILLERNK